VKPMLLVIDMLIDFLDRWPADERAALVAAIGALADGFHAAGHPVVWVRQEFAPDLSDAFGEMRRDNIHAPSRARRAADSFPSSCRGRTICRWSRSATVRSSARNSTS
jgi:nicotinamidase-related amidase